ncbi:putative O-antigen polymerase [Desulfosarcina variabilis str. Montpellier]|uniref:O-antigen ligase family protein n=1 Tax=Desulfosarcina variabilis TaxID=2300 RepID=UPI003AFADD86
MKKTSNVAIFFIISTVPIPFAAVQPWVWSFYAMLMIIAFITGVGIKGHPADSHNKYAKMGMAVFFIWALFLCMPIPFSLLSILSPVRAEKLAKAWELIGSVASYQAISYSQQDALAWWTFLLSLMLFYLVIRKLCEDKKTLKQIVVIMIAIGLVESFYGIVQALIPSMGVLWVDYIQAYLGSARGTFINRNNFAGFLEMVWPLALGLTLSMTGRIHSIKMVLHSDRLNRQALMALCIIVFLLTLILTRSRAGILCGMVGFIAFFLMARPGMRKKSKQFQVMLGGIVLFLAIYTMIIDIRPVIQRFFTIASDGSSRLNIWRDSLMIIRDHPLGIGLYNYGNVIEIYNQTGPYNKTIGYAHNDYLQLLIETGWIGFLALAGAMLFFLANAVRRIRDINFRKDPFRFYLAVGAFSGIASIGVHCLFDFNLQIPANCVYFVVLLAILNACTQSGQPGNTQTLTKVN